MIYFLLEKERKQQRMEHLKKELRKIDIDFDNINLETFKKLAKLWEYENALTPGITLNEVLEKLFSDYLNTYNLKS